MKYKVLVMLNRVKVEVKDDFEKAKDYIKRHNEFEVDFDFMDIDVPVETKLFLERDSKFWFGTKDIKKKVRKYVPENKYHAVIFAWDETESYIYNLEENFQSTYVLTSWSYWRELIKNTEFIELVTSPRDDKVDWIYKSIIHELYHSFVKRANRRGANIIDVMDSMIVDGVEVQYYKNHKPEAEDGNFAEQRKFLKGHVDKILYMPEKFIGGFETAVEIILENEGGYVNDQKDPGGETNMGISKNSYPHLEIKNITKEQAIEIYQRDFWNKIKGDSMPYGIALQLFDMAVNAGVSQASKLIQRIVGVKDDGIIGSISLRAINAYKGDINMDYLIARIKFYSALDGAIIYGAGWTNRAVKVYQFIA